MNAPSQADLPAPRDLIGEGLVLRPAGPADAEALYEAVRESLAPLSAWLSWCHAGYALEDARTWLGSRRAAWLAGEDFSWLVWEAASGRLLGGAGLNQFDWPHRRANLGYWTRASACGQGVAVRATRLVARFGFEALGLERIEIVAAVGNRPSQRVAEKAGAVREGVLRARIRVGSVQHDAVGYAYTRADFAS